MIAVVRNTIEAAKICTTSSAGKARVDFAIHTEIDDYPSVST